MDPSQPRRRFPPPWRITENDVAFGIADATGFVFAWVYFAEGARFIAMREHSLTKDEARRIARGICRLPELMGANPPAAAPVAPDGAPR